MKRAESAGRAENMEGEHFECVDDADAKFAKQMQAAGITPLHRVAIAVSGGADSMALCLLAAQWKRRSTETATRRCCGLVGFVVDHNLRSGSAEEAMCVQQWVCNLGLTCDILKCVWVDGVPPLGHLQESARNARYALLAQACQHTGIEALLTAHHADDQAELFILRLSRCSGIAGLAGMASAVTLHPELPMSARRNTIPWSLLLIRPLLKFVKEELYAICRNSGQDWVEDPTNVNLSFARNRIRKALREPPFVALRIEIQALIAFCRKTRIILDRDRDHLLADVTQVSQEWGHVTIDVEKLAATGASVAVLHRAVAAILQFVAQKVKPPRGRAVGSTVDHLRTKLSKGAYTVGGCNIFPSPGSKGSQAIICFSPDSPTPSVPSGVSLDHSYDQLSTELFTTFAKVPASLPHTDPPGVGAPALDELQSSSIQNAISVLTLDMKTPRAALDKFESLGLISEAGASLMKELASDVSKDMGRQPNKQLEKASALKLTPISSEGAKKSISFGESEHFMNRFLVKLNARPSVLDGDAGGSLRFCCLLRDRPTLWIRHFEEKDWAYLSCLARKTAGSQGWNLKTGVMKASYLQRLQRNCTALSEHHPQAFPDHLRPLTATFSPESQPVSGPSAELENNKSYELHKVDPCRRPGCDLERLSKAKEALVRLRSVPKLVRRGLPVLVTAQGLLLGIPSVGYGHCPLVSMTAVFRPHIPLGGGKATWL